MSYIVCVITNNDKNVIELFSEYMNQYDNICIIYSDNINIDKKINIPLLLELLPKSYDSLQLFTHNATQIIHLLEYNPNDLIIHKEKKYEDEYITLYASKYIQRIYETIKKEKKIPYEIMSNNFILTIPLFTLKPYKENETTNRIIQHIMLINKKYLSFLI
jgi:hypothetical protein